MESTVTGKSTGLIWQINHQQVQRTNTGLPVGDLALTGFPHRYYVM